MMRPSVVPIEFGGKVTAMTRLKRRLTRFRDEEDGAATIEMLIWVPTFIFLFVMISDASFIYYGKSQTMRVMQDGNRALSVGAIVDEEALIDRVTTQMTDMGYAGTVTAVIDSATGIVTTTVAVAANELTAVGSIPGLSNFDIVISSSHYLEQ